MLEVCAVFWDQYVFGKRWGCVVAFGLPSSTFELWFMSKSCIRIMAPGEKFTFVSDCSWMKISAWDLSYSICKKLLYLLRQIPILRISQTKLSHPIKPPRKYKAILCERQRMLPSTRDLLNNSSMQTSCYRSWKRLAIMFASLTQLSKSIPSPTIEHPVLISSNWVVLTTCYRLKLNAQVIIWVANKLISWT